MTIQDAKGFTIPLAVLLLTAGCATVSEEDEQRSRSRIRMAESHLRTGALELAIRQYRAAVELTPRNPEIYFGLGEAYRLKGRFEDAEQTFKTALKLDPEHQDVRLNLSALYLQEERWEEAIAECSALIDDPTFFRPARALVNRAWAYYKSGELDQAQDDLREALATDPGNFQVQLNLGIILLEKGETLAAMSHLNKAVAVLERRPDSLSGSAEAQVRFQIAQGHVKLGQRNKAVQQLRLAAERGGVGEWAQRSREYLALLE